MRQAGPVVVNILAAALPIITLPLITRLYAPDVYGAYTAFLALATLVCFLGTLRLDLAVLSASNGRQGLVLTLLLVGCITIAAILWLVLTGTVVRLSSFHPGVFGMGNGQAFTFVILAGMLIAAQALLTWRGKTAALAGLNMSFQIIFLCLTVLFSQIGTIVSNGMIDARFGALLLAAPALAATVLSVLKTQDMTSLRLTEIAQTARSQRKFVTFTYPYTIIGMLSADLILLVLLARNDLALAGAYGLVRSLMLAPGSIFGGAVSPLFFRFVLRESAEQCAALTASLARGVGPAGFFVYGLAAGAAAPLLLLAFGSTWTLAAIVLPIMSFPMAWTLLSGWPERIFEARDRAALSLQLHCLWASLSALFISAAYWIVPLQPLGVIAAFACAFLVYQLAYLTAAFRLCGLTLRWIGRFYLVVSGAYLIGYATSFFLSSVLSGAGLISAVAVLAALAGGFAIKPTLSAFARMNAAVSNG